MVTALISIHVIVCILLILIILLQSGKGATMGASFGAGSSQTLFGPTGPASILTKITTGVAIIFMITSLTLAMLSSRVSDSSVMESLSATKAPVEKKVEKTIEQTDQQPIQKTSEQTVEKPMAEASDQVPTEATTKPILTDQQPIQKASEQTVEKPMTEASDQVPAEATTKPIQTKTE
jgi:preprotein translocase subunit SecG